MMHNNRIKILLAILICCIFSCRQINVFEYNTTIPKQLWNLNFSATGSFKITDTASSYSIYLVLRHLDTYKYDNIWLDMGLAGPGDTLYHQKVNLTLASEANGWEGSGMNDIWEVRKLLNGQPRKFIKAGVYHFSINHIMRDNPLPGVLSAGLRVEKAP